MKSSFRMEKPAGWAKDSEKCACPRRFPATTPLEPRSRLLETPQVAVSALPSASAVAAATSSPGFGIGIRRRPLPLVFGARRLSLVLQGVHAGRSRDRRQREANPFPCAATTRAGTRSCAATPRTGRACRWVRSARESTGGRAGARWLGRIWAMEGAVVRLSGFASVLSLSRFGSFDGVPPGHAFQSSRPAGAANGREALLFVLLEHQSSSDKWMPLRMYVCLGRIFVFQPQ